VPTAAERAGDFSQSTDQNGAPIPNLFDFTTGGTFAGKMIPQDRLYQPGLAILNLWPLPNTTGLNYNYEVELPTVNTLIQQPAVRLDYQPKANWRVTGKYAGQMRSKEVNSIGGAAAPGVGTRIPGFNDYVEPYPWIGTISVTNNFTLTNTTYLPSRSEQPALHLPGRHAHGALRRPRALQCDGGALLPDAVRQEGPDQGLPRVLRIDDGVATEEVGHDAA
jgi:hypothetical protein